MTRLLRVVAVVCFVGATIAGFVGSAQAQQADIAFGVSTITAPGASNANGVDHQPVSLDGAAYPSFSGDFLLFHNFGVGAELFWRASQASYAGQGFNYRPLFYDFNAVYTPRLAKHVYAELVAGVGAESARFYTGTVCGVYSCSNYQSSNHFNADFGGGLKLYAKGGFFIRPEARFYVVNNNLEFSSNHLARYGVSIGYTFGGSR